MDEHFFAPASIPGFPEQPCAEICRTRVHIYMRTCRSRRSLHTERSQAQRHICMHVCLSTSALHTQSARNHTRTCTPGTFSGKMIGEKTSIDLYYNPYVDEHFFAPASIPGFPKQPCAEIWRTRVHIYTRTCLSRRSLHTEGSQNTQAHMYALLLVHKHLAHAKRTQSHTHVHAKNIFRKIDRWKNEYRFVLQSLCRLSLIYI